MGINLVGRFLSTLFDIGTILLLYVIGRRYFSTALGLMASFFYAISVLPIQLSHFYAVDTILTFFTTLTLYLCMILEEKRAKTIAIFLGASFGLALATKISAVVLLLPIAIALFYTLIRKTRSTPSFPSTVIATTILLFCIFLSTVLTFLVTSPYVIIDVAKFATDTTMQSAMTKNAFVFPYTLQYALKTPYLYELKNIFFFGLSPILAALSFMGFFVVVYQTVREKEFEKQSRNLIILSFVIVYFLIVGGFKIGFMRYMLPLYPLLCLFAAICSAMLYRYLQKHIPSFFLSICSLLLVISVLLWPLSFIAIYQKPNTRTQATNWILQNIPSGKTLATEHWDDMLPLEQNAKYKSVILPLYDPDTPEKWNGINSSLDTSDYIIIASNRLYTPLMKLTDCQKLPEDRCYPLTNIYYRNIFSGNSKFKKVAEFSSYPTVPVLGIPINDDSADESFTVYDHPKVMIFKRR